MKPGEALPRGSRNAHAPIFSHSSDFRSLVAAPRPASARRPIWPLDVWAGWISIWRRADATARHIITTRAQLGWQDGDFAHLAYVQVVANSGHWERGFAPITGFNWPGIDIGWSFTWTEKTTKLQFDGTTGVTFNFENNVSEYDSGTDFHAEWAIGREICQGLMIGVAGYDFRQLTGDSGPGARLGPFEGQVDAIGPAITYTTLIDKSPVVLSARHYEEFNAENRFSGSSTILSGTVRY